jgi:hypothetical protein
MDVGAKQYFVRIDVANACQSMLIQKPGFQLASSGLEKLAKIFLGDRQGIRPKPAFHEGFQAGWFKQPESTKSARVPIMQFPGFGPRQRDLAMDVLR